MQNETTESQEIVQKYTKEQLLLMEDLLKKDTKRKEKLKKKNPMLIELEKLDLEKKPWNDLQEGDLIFPLNIKHDESYYIEDQKPVFLELKSKYWGEIWRKEVLEENLYNYHSIRKQQGNRKYYVKKGEKGENYKKEISKQIQENVKTQDLILFVKDLFGDTGLELETDAEQQYKTNLRKIEHDTEIVVRCPKRTNGDHTEYTLIQVSLSPNTDIWAYRYADIFTMIVEDENDIDLSTLNSGIKLSIQQYEYFRERNKKLKEQEDGENTPS